jgi:hypothetical protein
MKIDLRKPGEFDLKKREGSGLGDTKDDATPGTKRGPKRARFLLHGLAAGLMVAGITVASVVIFGKERAAEDTAYSNARGEIRMLQIYLDLCKLCIHKEEAQKEIASIIEQSELVRREESTYREARGNLVKLRGYANSCKICSFSPSVHNEIAAIEEQQKQNQSLITLGEERTYRAARGDAHLLTAYLQDCRVCTFEGASRAEIARLEREIDEKRKQDQLKEQEEREYGAARGDLDRLNTYVRNCQTCEYVTTAKDEIARLEGQSQNRSMFITYRNQDLHGGDFQRLDGVNLPACVAACLSDSRCVAYSYDKWNRSCFLKSVVATLRLEPRSITGVRGDTQIPLSSTDPVIMEPYRSKVFPGSGYSSLTGSFESCQTACRESANCIAFSFVKAPRRCNLFDETGKYFPDNTADSGVKSQPVKIKRDGARPRASNMKTWKATAVLYY